MTESEAMELVGVLNAAWPREAMEEETLMLFARQIEELFIGDATEAVHELVLSSEKMPSIAAIHELSKEIRKKHARELAASRGLPEPDACYPKPGTEAGREMDALAKARVRADAGEARSSLGVTMLQITELNESALSMRCIAEEDVKMIETRYPSWRPGMAPAEVGA